MGGRCGEPARRPDETRTLDELQREVELAGNFFAGNPFFKRKEAALVLVPGIDGSGEDVVVPAVYCEGGVGEGARDRGVGLEVFELGDDVGVDKGGVEGRNIGAVDAGRKEFPGWFNVAEPLSGEGQARQVAGGAGVGGIGQNGLDRSAIGVATDDDVVDVEDFDGVLDGGGDAAGHGAVGGDDIAGGAAEEHVAGLGLEDEVGDDAGVGAGDEEGVRLLHVGQEMELVLHGGEDFAAELFVAGEETVHRVQGTG